MQQGKVKIFIIAIKCSKLYVFYVMFLSNVLLAVPLRLIQVGFYYHHSRNTRVTPFLFLQKLHVSFPTYFTRNCYFARCYLQMWKNLNKNRNLFNDSILLFVTIYIFMCKIVIVFNSFIHNNEQLIFNFWNYCFKYCTEINSVLFFAESFSLYLFVEFLW